MNGKARSLLLLTTLLLVGCTPSGTKGFVSTDVLRVSSLTKQGDVNTEFEQEGKEDSRLVESDEKINIDEETVEVDDSGNGENSVVQNEESGTSQEKVAESDQSSSASSSTATPEPSPAPQPSPQPQPIPEPDPAPTYNYNVGNSGELYDTEEEANAVAKKHFETFDDGIKYVQRYWVWSTYDKWTIEYQYAYWE